MADEKKSSKSEDKSKALAAALAQIEKQFGKGSIMKMDGSHQDEDLEVVSTGSLGLDLALGVGGLPPVKPPCVWKPSPKARKTAVCAPLSMPKTPSTRFMRASWA